MIERLQRALEHIDELSPDVQEQIARIIEENTAPSAKQAQSLAGVGGTCLIPSRRCSTHLTAFATRAHRRPWQTSNWRGWMGASRSERLPLDTSLVAAFLRGRLGAVALISPWIASNEVATSIIVFEYVSGFSNPSQWQAALRSLALTMPTFDLTYTIMERYAELRRAMRPPHGPGLIGDMDTLIAATAIEHDRTLVTLDGDYKRVPRLPIMLLPRMQIVIRTNLDFPLLPAWGRGTEGGAR